MALTLSNAGIANAPGDPFRIYKLIVTLDGTATTGSLAHGCPEAPLFYQNALGGSSTSIRASKVVANSSSASTVADITVSGAGTLNNTIHVLAFVFNQGS